MDNPEVSPDSVAPEKLPPGLAHDRAHTARPGSEQAQWGRGAASSKEVRFLSGPQKRSFDLMRSIRIFFEILHGFRRLHFLPPCVSVFGSARFKPDSKFYLVAEDVGRRLA